MQQPDFLGFERARAEADRRLERDLAAADAAFRDAVADAREAHDDLLRSALYEVQRIKGLIAASTIGRELAAARQLLAQIKHPSQPDTRPCFELKGQLENEAQQQYRAAIAAAADRFGVQVRGG